VRSLPPAPCWSAPTRPAEFFAVVTELFFERPADLRREHSDLCDEFRRYYRPDPVGRMR